MEKFRYWYPMAVRYADLDPQGHVNNAVYLSYIEQARIGYIQHLGLWDGKSYLDVGIILAEARVTYRSPILLSQPINVGVHVSRIGNKSFDMEYLIMREDKTQILAQASTTLVTYDYHKQQTVSVPEEWRQIIQDFEGKDEQTRE